MNGPNLHQSNLNWQRRLAWWMCCATFLMIISGGLVTTTQAGMAFPDWPKSGGYLLLFLPFKIWFASWDFFIEHKHRILGTTLGLLSIALCVTTWRMLVADERRRLSIAISFVLLVLIIVQGLLGGLRVNLDSRQVALIHGCTGPLVFALVVLAWDYFRSVAANENANSNATESSMQQARTNQQLNNKPSKQNFFLLAIASALLCAMSYGQLILGAFMRHGEWLHPHSFRTLTVFHVLTAMLIVTLIITLSLWIRVRFPQQTSLSRLSLLLPAAVIGQVLLGLATWFLKYGWPWGSEALIGWLPIGWLTTAVEARSWQQTAIITGHVAVGSLILAFSALLAARAWKLQQACRAIVSIVQPTLAAATVVGGGA